MQPSGREKRRSEAPIRSATQFARELAVEVISHVRAPYAVLGHSGGAVCTFELVRELRRLRWTLPDHLFVAGRRAPQLPMPRTHLESLPVEEVASVGGELGGTPQEPLTVPITAFAGTDDSWATPDLMAGWAAHTSSAFELYPLSGGHFAIFDHSVRVHQVIAAGLEPQL